MASDSTDIKTRFGIPSAEEAVQKIKSKARGVFKRAQTIVGIRSRTAEAERLKCDKTREKNWKRWGPYVSERQWATVREDYSADGSWYVVSFTVHHLFHCGMLVAGTSYLMIMHGLEPTDGERMESWECVIVSVVSALPWPCGMDMILF